ncbi:MAG: VWA domain-containing protein [Kofleriaceae bacterium]|nr:VWA domain-containing protein [Kofleriaceae bacterium]
MFISIRNSLFLSLLAGTLACGAQNNSDYAASSATNRRAMAADHSSMMGAPASMSESGDTYESDQENQVTSAADQSTSTFSIDVDTASYANARRFLRQGHLPPANSIRVEEFINYFRYAYAGPENDRPFAVHSEVASSPWTPGHKLLKIGIQGKRLDNSALPKRNLVFLLDVSGSMSASDKLPLLKQGFRMLSNTLGEDDRVSIVVYAGAAGAVLLPTSGADKHTIMEALDNLQGGGGTNGGQGIELAYKLAEQNFDPDAVNRIILASDGDFNVGMTNKNELVKLIERKRKSGVYLSVLGFGRGNLNDATMEQLADKGNGNYSYIDSVSEAKKVLVEEGASTLITIAKDVKIQVEFDTEMVENYRLIGYENRVMANEDFDNDAADAGELGPGHSVSALYEFLPKEGANGKSIAELRLRYKLPNGEQSYLLTQDIGEENESSAGASTEMRFASAVAGFALLLKHSEFSGQLGWDRVEAMASDALGENPSKYRKELLELIRVARGLSQSTSELAQ